jgi:putative Mn2+ efflux pump MntP
MPAWFGGSYKDYVFKMFSTSHFVIIALLLLVSIGIYLYKDNFKNEKLSWRYLSAKSSNYFDLFESLR